VRDQLKEDPMKGPNGFLLKRHLVIFFIVLICYMQLPAKNSSLSQEENTKIQSEIGYSEYRLSVKYPHLAEPAIREVYTFDGNKVIVVGQGGAVISNKDGSATGIISTHQIRM
jgi:hypothetical protein